jgi:hypothetical protein
MDRVMVRVEGKDWRGRERWDLWWWGFDDGGECNDKGWKERPLLGRPITTDHGNNVGGSEGKEEGRKEEREWGGGGA